MWLLALLACTDPEPDVPRVTNGTVAYDANNDGFADVAIFQQPERNGNSPGSLQVFYGGADGLSNDRTTSLAISIVGGHAHWVGDLNGDGFADAAVASEDFGASPVVSIGYGGPQGSGETTQVQCNQGEAPESESGAQVSRVGDLDGDGIDDLMVTAAGGRLCVWNGRPERHTGDPDLFRQGNVSSNFPVPFHGVGDLNGDGFDDVAMGNDIRTGSSSGLTEDTLFLPQFPFTGVMDADGDGAVDFVTGGVSVMSWWTGGADGFESSINIAHSVDIGVDNLTGQELVPLGDVTGDGRDDLGLSVPWSSDVATGWVALLEGGPEGFHMDTPRGTQILPEWEFLPTGEAAGINGFRTGLMIGIGDIDGDGIGDIGVEVYSSGLAWIRGSTGRIDQELEGWVSVPRASPCMAATGSGVL